MNVHQHSVKISRFILYLTCIVLLAACMANTPVSSSTKGGVLAKNTSQSSSLGSAPQNCPLGPTPRKVDVEFGPAIGNSPLWATNFGGPHATMHLSHAPYTKYGWEVKILWLLEPNSTQPITLQGNNATTTSRHLYFNITGRITQSATLDPTGTPQGKWSSFPSNVFIPSVGCYVFKATWSNKTWQVPFTAAP